MKEQESGSAARSFKNVTSYGKLLKKIARYLTDTGHISQRYLPKHLETLIREHSKQLEFQKVLLASLETTAAEFEPEFFAKLMRRILPLTADHKETHQLLINLAFDKAESMWEEAESAGTIGNAILLLSAVYDISPQESKNHRIAEDDLLEIMQNLAGTEGDAKAASFLRKIAFPDSPVKSKSLLLVESECMELERPDMTPERFLEMFSTDDGTVDSATIANGNDGLSPGKS